MEDSTDKALVEPTTSEQAQVSAAEEPQAHTGADGMLADQQPSQRENDFINHGLLRWEKAREKWLEHNKTQAKKEPRHAKELPVDDIIDTVFMSSKQFAKQGGPTPFPENVPLPQMIDILQDLWEAEGLDV